MSVRTNVYFDTPDHVHIVGDYVLPEEDIRSVAVFLHMMPATRKSYMAFQEAVALCGVASLAIDLRGHGDSTTMEGREEPLDYNHFSEKEHQSSIWDVRGAVQYLTELTNTPVDRCMLVGASIGANLALQFSSEEHRIPLTVALSPGLTYRGIETLPLVSAIDQTKQRLLLAASTEDTYSREAAQKLHAAAPDASTAVIREGFEHGTDMFQDQEFALKIARALCAMHL